MNKTKLFLLFLLIADVASLIYLLGLGSYNSLLIDDYGFSSRVDRIGIINLTLEMYNTWQGRFGMFLISGSFFKIFGAEGNVLAITILNLILGFGSIYLFLSLFFKTLNRWLLFLVSVFLVNLSIMSLFEISTFYWVCASVYISIIFLSFLLSWIIFNPHLNKFFAYISIFLLTIFVGGGAETYTPLVIMLLGIVLLLKLKQHGFKALLNDHIARKLLFALLCLFIFFILMVIAPGNKVRMDFIVNTLHKTHPTGFTLIVKTFRSMLNLFFLIGAKKGYYLLAFPVFYYLAVISKDKWSKIDFPVFKFVYLFYSLILLLSFLWISVLPGVYATGDLMVQRALTYVSFVMIIFFAIWGFYLGVSFPNKKLALQMSIVGFVLFSGFSIYFSSTEFVTCRNYQKEIKLREELLLNLQKENFKGVAKVKPIVIHAELSSYSILWNQVVGRYKAEKKTYHEFFPYERFVLSCDKTDWKNVGLKEYLKLDYDIVCDSTGIINTK